MRNGAFVAVGLAAAGWTAWFLEGGATAGPVPPAREPAGAAIEWRTDLPAAVKEAADTGRPLLVVFR